MTTLSQTRALQFLVWQLLEIPCNSCVLKLKKKVQIKMHRINDVEQALRVKEWLSRSISDRAIFMFEVFRNFQMLHVGKFGPNLSSIIIWLSESR